MDMEAEGEDENVSLNYQFQAAEAISPLSKKKAPTNQRRKAGNGGCSWGHHHHHLPILALKVFIGALSDSVFLNRPNYRDE